MRKSLISISLSCLCCLTAYAQAPAGSMDSPTEDKQSNELIKNPSFEDEAKPIRNRRFGPNGEGELFGGRLPAGTILGWIPANSEGAASKMETTAEKLLADTQQKALQWTITEATTASPAAIANVGNHGIEVIEGHKYTLTFWARADKKYKGKIRVGLQSKSSDGVWYAQAKIKGKVKKRWKKYTVTFTTTQSDENARFVLSADRPGTLYLDQVSLYSPGIIKR